MKREFVLWAIKKYHKDTVRKLYNGIQEKWLIEENKEYKNRWMFTNIKKN